MRVAPIGVIYPSSELSKLIRGSYECAIPTHGGQLAICAAAAVAGAVSAALEGRPCADILAAALNASWKAESLRPSEPGVTIAQSIELIHSDLFRRRDLIVDEVARQYFPNSPQISVPLAISLALITQSVEKTVLFAANLGGDSDSVASIGGAIAGALRPETINESWFEVVRTTIEENLLNLAPSSRSNPTAFEAVGFQRNSTRMDGWRNIGIAHMRRSI